MYSNITECLDTTTISPSPRTIFIYEYGTILNNFPKIFLIKQSPVANVLYATEYKILNFRLKQSYLEPVQLWVFVDVLTSLTIHSHKNHKKKEIVIFLKSNMSKKDLLFPPSISSSCYFNIKTTIKTAI